MDHLIALHLQAFVLCAIGIILAERAGMTSPRYRVAVRVYGLALAVFVLAPVVLSLTGYFFYDTSFTEMAFWGWWFTSALIMALPSLSAIVFIFLLSRAPKSGRTRRRTMILGLAVTLAILAAQVLWVRLQPHTLDGDSTIHQAAPPCDYPPGAEPPPCANEQL